MYHPLPPLKEHKNNGWYAGNEMKINECFAVRLVYFSFHVVVSL